MSGQKKTHSLIEALANTVLGFGVMFVAQKVIFPLFDIHVSSMTNVKIGLCFTVVSIARSYVFRRIGNWITTRTESFFQ